jgi:hypothetical protein
MVRAGPSLRPQHDPRSPSPDSGNIPQQPPKACPASLLAPVPVLTLPLCHATCDDCLLSTAGADDVLDPNSAAATALIPTSPKSVEACFRLGIGENSFSTCLYQPHLQILCP